MKPLSHTIFRLLISLSIVMIILQWPPLQSLFQWDKAAIIHGQLWRILTGNFTHTNLYHLLMNLAGFWLVMIIFKAQVHTRSLMCLIILLSATIGIGLMTSSLEIYLGFSGVLHGLFAYYVLMEVLNGRISSLLLLLGLCGKIIWEQGYGSATGSELLIEARVAIEAHFIGSLTGLLIAGINKRFLVSRNRFII